MRVIHYNRLMDGVIYLLVMYAKGAGISERNSLRRCEK
jgi:hypothetical protein